MLTRSRVARVLKRSIATVRRLEGKELFPWKDASGVHRFDAREVRKVARLLRTDYVSAAQSAWLAGGRRAKLRSSQTGIAERGGSDGLLQDVARLRLENADLTKALEGLTELLEE